MRYAAALEVVASRGAAPVEQWNPARTGDIDIEIKSDGTWFHEGAPIRRARLVKLFSTILKREGETYYLVTPAEKLKITVEDAPFVAVLMNVESDARSQRITFSTNLGEKVIAGPEHGIVLRPVNGDELAPYLHIRGGLEARIARAVYYDLVALGERRQMDGVEEFGVWSDGHFFPFGPVGDP